MVADVVCPIQDRVLAGTAVALLSETAHHLAQLRDAVASLGMVAVYESTIGAFDSDALARSQAKVVVVNLDADDGEGADLGALLDLLEGAHYRVVFNDGDVSGGLSGWDHARWLRHLAAKIAGGSAGLYPPRPPGTQAVEVLLVASLHEPQSEVALFDIPAAAEDEALASAQPTVELAQSLVQEALEAGGDEPFGALSGIDLDGLELIDFGALPEPPEFSVPRVSDEKPDAAIAALQAPAESFDAITWYDADPPPVEHAHDHGAAAWLPDLVGTPMDADDAIAPAVGHDDMAPQQVIAPEWTLEDLIEMPPAPLPSTAQATASDFGIETVRPADFLAPAVDENSPPLVEVPETSTLELIPLEEAVAPVPIETAGRESWLESASMDAPSRVTRVWVLGASIGGPESVRAFLSGLPRDYPALFLLAQHLGDEFTEMMAAQLAKATMLTVRTPQHGDRVGHGEVMIVPAGKRLRVDAAGVVVLEAAPHEGAYSPSIDGVLRDCADTFGAHAGAVVFSGMSDDAVEGCCYLASKGGPVYAQDPNTCVVSTMVEGVCDAGVVSFLGSPQELAEKLRDAVA